MFSLPGEAARIIKIGSSFAPNSAQSSGGAVTGGVAEFFTKSAMNTGEAGPLRLLPFRFPGRTLLIHF